MFLQTFASTLLVSGALVVPLTALANPFETTLTNGMKVIVKEDRRAPSAVHMVWYRSGSMDEQEGVSGVAHVLEHMMFKGTKNVGPGEFNKRVAAVGGRDNAFTGKDYTAYFQQIPPDRLGEMMALEADRMQHLVLDDDSFHRELEVVKEERRLRTDDQPRALVYEQLMATAFKAHPYRRPVIGWMPDLEAMRPDDARDWYRRWYTPANAYLVVVGDVDHRRVFRDAERHYGPIVPRTLPARRISAEPAQQGPRQAVVKAPAELPYLSMAWHVRCATRPRTAMPMRCRCCRRCSTATTAPVSPATWCATAAWRCPLAPASTAAAVGPRCSTSTACLLPGIRSTNSKPRCVPNCSAFVTKV